MQLGRAPRGSVEMMDREKRIAELKAGAAAYRALSRAYRAATRELQALVPSNVVRMADRR